MNNLSFCWNCWIRCGEIDVICVALIFFIAFLFGCFHNIEALSIFIHPAFARKFRLWQLWKMFLGFYACFFWRSSDFRTLLPLFPSQVKWTCAACKRRKIQCLLCLSHGLAVLGATAHRLRCIVHLCRSFLGFQVLLLELHIAFRFMSFLLAMQR